MLQSLTRSWTSLQALAEWRRWFRKRSTRGEVMKIVVIGGTGLIGSKVVEKLKQKGHEVIAAAPNTGVNTITGEGLADALAGAQVVVDVANSPSFEDQAAMDFIEIAGPDTFTLDEPVRKVLEYDNDTRKVIADPQAPYFGIKVTEKALVPGPNPRLGSTKFDWWLTHVPPPQKR